MSRSPPSVFPTVGRMFHLSLGFDAPETADGYPVPCRFAILWHRPRRPRVCLPKSGDGWLRGSRRAARSPLPACGEGVGGEVCRRSPPLPRPLPRLWGGEPSPDFGRCTRRPQATDSTLRITLYRRSGLHCQAGHRSTSYYGARGPMASRPTSLSRRPRGSSCRRTKPGSPSILSGRAAGVGGGDSLRPRPADVWAR